jgi:hypothetical protein
MPFAVGRRSPLAALAAVCLVGCSRQVSPTAPTSTPPPTTLVAAAEPAAGAWMTERTVVAITDRRVDPTWASTETVGGVRRGVRLAVRSDDYLPWPSAFRGGTLRGTFSDDFSTFEAHSTLSWGPPGADLTVTYRWQGLP